MGLVPRICYCTYVIQTRQTSCLLLGILKRITDRFYFGELGQASDSDYETVTGKRSEDKVKRRNEPHRSEGDKVRAKPSGKFTDIYESCKHVHNTGDCLKNIQTNHHSLHTGRRERRAHITHT